MDCMSAGKRYKSVRIMDGIILSAIKEGSAPFIAQEYQALLEKEKVGSEIEYHNHHPFRKARNE